MVSATIPMPPRNGLRGQNPIFLKDQNIKYINTISMYGEKFYQLHAAQRPFDPQSNDSPTEPLRSLHVHFCIYMYIGFIFRNLSVKYAKLSIKTVVKRG